jgi:hypothetical protein
MRQIMTEHRPRIRWDFGNTIVVSYPRNEVCRKNKHENYHKRGEKDFGFASHFSSLILCRISDRHPYSKGTSRWQSIKVFSLEGVDYFFRKLSGM